MTLQELKGRYARLGQEIDGLAAAGVRHQARLLCLMDELDRVHRQLGDLRLRTLHVPTLREVVECHPAPATPAAFCRPVEAESLAG
jgi:hypothetical protein